MTSSTPGKITGYFPLALIWIGNVFVYHMQKGTYYVQKNVTDEEASQIDTAEMKNLNEKYKAESGIIIFNDCDSTVGELRN
jgi:hypothetical protein